VSFTKVKPSGWAFGEKLTSAQLNTLDTDHGNSLDIATLSLGSTPVSVSRRAPGCPFISQPTDWDTQNQHLGYIECLVANAVSAFWPISLPNGATLTSLGVVLEPTTGHAALPVSMPRFELVSIANDGTVVSEVAFVTDSSASVIAYQTLHTIVSGALSVVINNATKRYLVAFSSEGSTNALAGLKFYHPYYSFTMLNLDFA
jgi:hypothetical protein